MEDNEEMSLRLLRLLCKNNEAGYSNEDLETYKTNKTKWKWVV